MPEIAANLSLEPYLHLSSNEASVEIYSLQAKFKRWHQGLRMLAVSKEKKLKSLNTSYLHQIRQFADFVHQAPAGICVLGGDDFIFESLNPAYQQLFPDRILLGRPILQAVPELELQNTLQSFRHVYLTGETYKGNEEQRLVARVAGGELEERFFNFTCQARFNEQQQINGLMVCVFDVTGFVTARREVQLAEAHSREMFDSIRQIAFTMDPTGRLTFVNQRWKDFTGLDFDRDRDNIWNLTMHPDELQSLSNKFAGLLESCTGGEFEFRKKRHDGVFLWHLCCLHPILDVSGKILFWMGTSTDIEVLKRGQQQKDDFMNIASHELKTPLTSLKVSLQLMDERKENMPDLLRAKLMKRASSSLDKVVNLVEDLLNVGKFNQGHFELNSTRFNVYKHVKSWASEIEATSQLNISFTGQKSLCVFADAKWIEQAVINILNNAIKYAPLSRSIEIDILGQLDFVKITISDHGPGIASETIPLLFDRYYRVGNTNYESTGLGIGLYICSEIVKRHGGEIGVYSELKMGTSFWFTIPLNELSLKC